MSAKAWKTVLCNANCSVLDRFKIFMYERCFFVKDLFFFLKKEEKP